MVKEEKRKIIHIDMDAFYASVEQRDNPELRGKPIAVGGIGGRGVVATASYEARKFGVHSAMPSHVAIRKCPMLQFVRPRFDQYRSVSSKIHAIFHRYTDIIEPLSLDEAYLDVTYANYPLDSATLLAQQIKNDILNELRLVASAGVSYNKFLAKIASDEDKPDGLFVIPPGKGAEFVQNLAIEKFFGVGKVTAQKLKDNGIFNGKDILPYARWELQQIIGKQGGFLYDIVRGIDYRPVKAKRIRKSIGVETTFSEDISEWDRVNEEFSLLFETWWNRYTNANKKAKTLSIKIKTSDFKTMTRSYTDSKYVTMKEEARRILIQLLKDILDGSFPIRLLGLTASSFEKEKKESKQLSFW